MKTCNKCKKQKELTEFGKNRKRLDGYRYECKECRNASLRTGKPNLGRFKKGQIPWIKGKKHPNPIGGFKKGNTPWNKEKFTSGKKRYRQNLKWSKDVRKRDNYTCQICGTKEGKIVAHHIVPWLKNEEKRFDLQNGQTLCQSCHAKLEGFQRGYDCRREGITWH